MSAFIVSHDHIDALLSFAKDRRMLGQLSYYIQPSKADKLDWGDIGRVLLAENDRSVCHRYSDCTPGGEEVAGYSFRYFEQFAHMPHVQKCVWIIKNCDCFDYQACETDDYDQSIAHRIIRAIRGAAIRCLPDYEAAPWGINRRRSAA